MPTLSVGVLPLLCGCILLALAFLLGRVAWLQVISPDMLVKEGDMRSLRVQQVSTSRGMITDRFWSPVSGERAGKSDLG
ncbi:peptidoglycan synthetase FtsI [Escherichia coli]|uniref:Peptidoglycan synthetase FtsI n=1 Tax=Escherichia coli TaxID=562 RepID=A0A376MRZ1_ECOLX|nr:peptidoglycan synthetase FtsI [Escherichia coli]